jgi:hypothetical protein
VEDLRHKASNTKKTKHRCIGKSGQVESSGKSFFILSDLPLATIGNLVCQYTGCSVQPQMVDLYLTSVG